MKAIDELAAKLGVERRFVLIGVAVLVALFVVAAIGSA